MMRSSTPFWKVISAFESVIVQRPEGFDDTFGRSLFSIGCSVTGTMTNGFFGIEKAPPSFDTLIIREGAFENYALFDWGLTQLTH